MTAHEVETPPGHTLLWRVCAVLCSVLVLLAIATAPARAVEDVAPAEGGEAGAEEDPLTFEELQAESSQRAQEFFPDPYEEPSFFQWISIPVLIVGLVLALLLLGAYLWWQPKFAAERRERQRR